MFFISDNNINTKAYYEDANGNLVSDNLIVLEDVAETTKNGITYSISNGVLNFNGTATSGFSISIFQYNIQNTQGLILKLFYDMNSTNPTTNVEFNCSTDTSSYYLQVRITSSNYTSSSVSKMQASDSKIVNKCFMWIPNGTVFNNAIIKPMLVSGLTVPTDFEVGGSIWYNEDYVNTLEEQVNDLEEQVDDLEEQVNDLEEQVNSYESDISSYFNYIIGNNYFANASFTFNQRVSNFNDTLKVSSNPLDVGNLYLVGNKLNSSSSFNYLLDNAMVLDVNTLTYIHVYQDVNYSTSNFTYVSYFPHYNLPSNERSGSSMPLKYINMSIDGSNYNGLVRLTCQVVGGNSPSTYQYIDIEKDVNNMYVINFPTSDLFLVSIDIQAVFSNGTYAFPTSIYSNVEQVESVSDYNLGYETAKSEYENALHTSEEINAQLQQERDNIYSQYRDLVDRYNQSLYSDNALSGMILAIVDAPINIFKNIFDFEILGINIIGVVFGIITLLLIIWLIKKLL